MKKVSKLAFFLLVLFLPTQLGKHFWPDFSYVFGQRIDYFSPTIYLTDVLIFVLLLLDRKRIMTFFRQKFIYGAIVLMWSFFWVHWQNQSPGLLVYKWLRLAEWLFLVTWVKRNVSFREVILPLNLSIIWTSFLAFGQLCQQRSLGFWFLGERTFQAGTPAIALANWQGTLFLRPYATFSHPNVLAGYALVVFIFNLFAAQAPKILRRLTLIASASVMLMAFSRTVWLTWWLVMLVFLIQRLKK